MNRYLRASRRALCAITITNNTRKYHGCDGDDAIREPTNPSVAYHIFPYNNQPFGRSTILLFHLCYLYFFSFLLQQSYSSLRTTSYLWSLKVLFPCRIIFYIAIEYHQVRLGELRRRQEI